MKRGWIKNLSKILKLGRVSELSEEVVEQKKISKR